MEVGLAFFASHRKSRLRSSLGHCRDLPKRDRPSAAGRLGTHRPRPFSSKGGGGLAGSMWIWIGGVLEVDSDRSGSRVDGVVLTLQVESLVNHFVTCKLPTGPTAHERHLHQDLVLCPTQPAQPGPCRCLPCHAPFPRRRGMPCRGRRAHQRPRERGERRRTYPQLPLGRWEVADLRCQDFWVCQLQPVKHNKGMYCFASN